MKFLKQYKPLLYLLNSKHDVIALTGGRGSGKTQHSLRGILTACTQKKIRVCFFRETKDTVTNSLMAEAEQIIEQDFSNRGFSSTKTEINHVNGSNIFYKGLKEVNLAAIENLKGIASSTDIFLVDEAQSVSKAVWDVLIPTLRKSGSVLIVCYNRINNNLPVEEALFLDYNTMTAPEGTYFVEVNYPELAKHGLLAERFLKRAELMKQNRLEEYNIIYLNQPPDMSCLTVIKNFSKSENIKTIHYQPDMDLHISCDFNVDPMSWVLAHKTDDKVFYFDEVVIENTTTEKATEEVIRRYPDHKGKIIINGDAAGDFRSTQSEVTNYIIMKNVLQKHYPNKVIQFDVRPFNPRVKNRIKAFNNMVLDLKGQRRVIIDSKCKWLLYNIYNLKYKEGSDTIDLPTHNQIKTNREQKYLMHPFDAASYLVDYYFPIKREEFDPCRT